MYIAKSWRLSEQYLCWEACLFCQTVSVERGINLGSSWAHFEFCCCYHHCWLQIPSTVVCYYLCFVSGEVWGRFSPQYFCSALRFQQSLLHCARGWGVSVRSVVSCSAYYLIIKYGGCEDIFLDFLAQTHSQADFSSLHVEDTWGANIFWDLVGLKYLRISHLLNW